jgi:hypothetical protein
MIPMAAPSESSMVGSSAQMLVDVAPEQEFNATAYQRDYQRRHGKKLRAQKLPAPLPGEGIPAGMCRRCGLVIDGARRGEHVTPADCIAGLRDLIAYLQFKSTR